MTGSPCPAVTEREWRDIYHAAYTGGSGDDARRNAHFNRLMAALLAKKRADAKAATRTIGARK